MPKIVMTLMVRDEADIVAAMLEHHLAQGVDFIIATDNASVDGTREVLRAYADAGVLELHDDPRHEKQQAKVVTAMARRAALVHGADWVINADADEFFVPTKAETLADALAAMPEEAQSFNARVRNLMGTPLASGSAVSTHVWRDERSEDELAQVGLHAHPTDDCIHRASPDVNVVQGNHATDLPLATEVPEAASVEVLHLPYRAWDRYRRRVEITAEAYARSNQTPSPRHHGMRDARWQQQGVLKHVFVARHPAGDSPTGFVLDRRVADSIDSIVTSGRAVCPDQLATALTRPNPVSGEESIRTEFARFSGVILAAAELQAGLDYRTQEFYTTLQRAENAEHEANLNKNRVTDLEHALEVERRRAEALAAETESMRAMLSDITGSRAVRTTASLFVKSYDQKTFGGGLTELPARAISAAKRLKR